MKASLTDDAAEYVGHTESRGLFVRNRSKRRGGYRQGDKRLCAVTDYHMPGMHGVDLIQQLRRLSPTRFSPMLVLTTDSEPEKRAAAKAAGATGWLVKPVSPTDLLKVVAQLVPGA